MAWPQIPFVPIDEIRNKFVFERAKEFEEIKETPVLLIPVMEKYAFNGIMYNMALTRPVVVNPDRQSIADIVNGAEKGGGKVARLFVFAKGHSFATISLSINYSGDIGKGRRILVEMARLNNDMYGKFAEVVMRELAQPQITVTKILTFEEAMQSSKMMSTCELMSPVIHDSGFRSKIILWNIPEGTNVKVALTDNDREVVRAFLLPKS